MSRNRGFKEHYSESVGRWPPPILAWCIEQGLVEAAYFEITRKGERMARQGGGWERVFGYAAAQTWSIAGPEGVNRNRSSDGRE